MSWHRSLFGVVCCSSALACSRAGTDHTDPASKLPSPPTRFSSADSADLVRLEYRLADAVLRRNGVLMDSLMGDDWTITLADGRRSNKTRAIKRWTTPPTADDLPSTSVVDSVAVQWLGADAAVLTAAITDIDVKRTAAETTWTRVTDIVMRRDGRWVMVASHESIRPPQVPTRQPLR